MQGERYVNNSCAYGEVGSLSLCLVLCKVTEGCIVVKAFHIFSIEYVCMTVKWTASSLNWT